MGNNLEDPDVRWTNRDFEKTRAAPGKSISEEELSKRLAYELQVPNTYGKRLYKAFRAVIDDALSHGEGIKFSTGVLRLQKYKTRYHVQGYLQGQLRTKMYKFKFIPNPYGDKILEEITMKEYGDIGTNEV